MTAPATAQVRQDQVQRSLGGLPEAVQRKVLYETAEKVYQVSV